MPQIIAQVDDAAAGGGGEVQYVNFRVITPGDLQIDATSNAGLGDSVIYLYRREADGTLTLVASDDDGGGFPNSQLVLAALPAGEYVLAVSEFSLSDGEARVGVNPDSGGANTYTVTLTEAGGLTFLVHDGDDVAVDVNVVEDTPTVFTAELLVNDPGGDNLTVTAVRNVVGGTAVIDANGDVVFTPTANYTGPYSFNFDATDGNGNITGVQTGLVTNVNDAPDAVADAYATNEDVALVVAAPGVLGNDTDADGDALTVTGYSFNPAQGNLVMAADGSFTFTPAADFNGPFTFSYSVSDGNGGFDTVSSTINVAAVDDLYVAQDDGADPGAPGAAGGFTPFYAFNEDTTFGGNINQLLANDTNPDGDVIDVESISNLFDAVTGLQVGTIAFDDVAGTFVITPNANYNGETYFDYTARNTDTGETDTGRVFVTVNSVNDAPVVTATADPGEAVQTEDQDVTFAGLLGADDFQGGAPDENNLPITFQLVNGTVTRNGVVIPNANITVNPDGSFEYNGQALDQGLDTGESSVVTFQFVAVDSNGGTSAPSTATINITGVNDAPVAVDDVFAGTEDTTLPADASRNLVANDTDVDGEPLTAIAGTYGTTAGGTVTVFSNGTFSYTPPANFQGSDTFLYTVTDGTANDVGQATINVGNTADAPVAVNDFGTVREDPVRPNSGNLADTPLVDRTEANGWFSEASLLGNDTDPDGTLGLQLTGVGSAIGGTVQLVTVGGVDYAVFTPAPNYSGEAQFDYVVTDPQGNSDIGRVFIDVYERPDGAPVANDDVIAVTEQVTQTITAAELLGNDTDPDNAAAGAGTDQLFVRDVFNLVNARFSAGNDGFYGTADDGNFVRDADGNILSFEIETLSDQNGLDASFSYAVDDSAARPNLDGDTDLPLGEDGVIRVVGAPDTRTGTDVGTVTLDTAAVEDAPIANNDLLGAINEDSVVGRTFTTAELLGNDSDPDNAGGSNAGLTVVSVAGLTPGSGASVAVEGGTLTANANGTFTFVPAADYFGTSDFSYVIQDPTGRQDTGTVSIPVNSVNDAPVATDDGTAPVGLLQLGPCNVLVPEDGSATFTWAQLLGNDTGGPANEDQDLRILSGSSAFGTVTVDPINETVTFTPTPGYVGQATFTYVVSDDGQDNVPGNGDDLTDTGTAFVNVVNTVIGSAGNDVISGGNQQSVIVDGLAGDDTINGTAFTDELDGGAGNDTINGGDGRDYIDGGTGDDTLNGDGGNDFLYTDDGGTDVANGGAGNDGIFAGNALDTTDTNNGGAGIDSLAIRGSGYAGGYLFGVNNLIGIETLIVGSSNNVTTWCGADTDPGDFDYNLITRDANVAAGTILTVIGNGLGNGAPGLQANESFRFDGSDEKDGAFRIYAGQGDNDFLGGEQNDGFFFETGAWAGGDETVDGRGGTADSVAFRGDYNGGAAFSTAGIVRVENIVLLGEAQTQFGGVDTDSDTFDYTVTVTNATATTSSGVLNIRGETLEVGEVLIVNAQNVVDAGLTIFGGASNDTITGGLQGNGLGGTDLIYGGRGGDSMNGGGANIGGAFAAQDGTNVYGYLAASDSTSTNGISVGNIDRISGFDFTVDRIDINAGGPAVNGLAGGIAGLNITDTNAVFNGNLTLQDSNDPALDFDSELARQINDALNPGQGAFLQVTTGGLGGSTVFVADVNGNGSYDAGTDLVIIFDNLVSQLPPTTEWII